LVRSIGQKQKASRLHRNKKQILVGWLEKKIENPYSKARVSRGREIVVPMLKPKRWKVCRGVEARVDQVKDLAEIGWRI